MSNYSKFITTMAVVASLITSAIALQGDARLPRRRWLGAGFAPPAAASKGVAVSAVTPGGSAANAGLKPNDAILSIDDRPMNEAKEIVTYLTTSKAGAKWKVKVVREGKEQTLTIPLLERPADKGEDYEVVYSHVVSHGSRLRMIISKPTKFTGKRPVMFLVQGIGYVSMDNPLSGGDPYSRILKAFNDKGFVTVRMDKPGLGDSEGGPADAVDFDRDLDTFRQGLLAVKKLDYVDADNVFVFGHSMGGCEGPVIASEIPIKGLIVYGTVSRTWEEYMLDSVRQQGTLSGTPYAALDGAVRQMSTAIHLLFEQKLSPAEAKAKYPQFASSVDSFTPDGRTMSGMSLVFWKGCFAYNFGEAWTKVNSRVLSLYGETDFVAEQKDHPYIAEIVNSVHPGMAEYRMIPQSDHGMRQTSSMKDSADTWTTGGRAFNPAVIKVMTDWVDSVMAAKSWVCGHKKSPCSSQSGG